MTNSNFHSTQTHQHPRLAARIMSMTTPHGACETPMFMPVATRAAVNQMTPVELKQAGSQMVLGGNTYHMLVAPGMEVIQANGGMHRFMAWDQPMLTDSGGFQVFSLSKNSKICKIDERGAHFKHPTSGKVIHLTPQSSIATQKTIGADIIMAFDECTPEQGGRKAAEKAMARTHRWLMESIEAHHQQPCSTTSQLPQALFGIIQGGSHRDLREQSTDFIVNSGVDGIAIGGEVIGFDMAKTVEVINWVRPQLPTDRMRYTMGVGLNPQDLIDVVAEGIDMFDCVAPTRNARHGALYHGMTIADGDWVKFDNFGQERGRILIKKSIYAKDDQPILAGCECYTCQHFSRGYLHYLFKERQIIYSNLACIHNIHVMHQTCSAMREAIRTQ